MNPQRIVSQLTDYFAPLTMFRLDGRSADGGVSLGTEPDPHFGHVSQRFTELGEPAVVVDLHHLVGIAPVATLRPEGGANTLVASGKHGMGRQVVGNGGPRALTSHADDVRAMER